MPAITKWTFAAALAFGSIGLSNPGAAQTDDFLDGPITMIVPFGRRRRDRPVGKGHIDGLDRRYRDSP